jgi:hypothetical protein
LNIPPTNKSTGGSVGPEKSSKKLGRSGVPLALGGALTSLGVAADMTSPKSTAMGTPDKAPKFPTTAKEVKIGKTYYDPSTSVGTSGRFARRKKVGPGKVGPGKVGSTFDQAFEYHRKAGEKEFTYGGKRYTTQMAQEQFIFNYLLDEGFASNQKSAEAIMSAMSEGWMESIVEDIAGNQYTPNPIGNAIKTGAGLIKKVLGNSSSGGTSTKPGDGKSYPDGPLWDGGGPKTSPKPPVKKGPADRDEPLW